MNFTNPQLLYGLFALLIPIVVHLFNFRRAKKVYFSNTQFLKQVQQTSSAKRKLKHYLVLLSRLLALFFLVMAFAQPFLPANEKGLNSNHVCIYIDNSQSMENTTVAGVRAFDEAISYVEEITALYPKGTQFRVLTNDFSPFANTYKTSRKIGDYLTEIELGGVSRTLNEIEDRRVSVMQAMTNTTEEVYVISDFQASTSGNLQNWHPDSLSKFYFLPINFGQTQNLSIDSLYVESPFILNSDKVSLVAVLKNYGKEAVSNTNIKVFIEEVQVSSASVSLAAGEQRALQFDIAYDLKPENRARITIDDYPVMFDDEFFFVVNTMERVNVLEIKEKQETTPVGKVYGNKELFNTIGQTVGNIDYSLIQSSDLVVVNALPKISSSLVAALQRKLAAGGRLLLIPPARGVEEYGQLFPGLKALATDSSFYTLQHLQLDNPFFDRIFEEDNESFNMPKARAVATWGIGVASTLLAFELGNPFLSSVTRQGTVFMLAAPLQDSYTDFQNHALFVPVMYKIATYKTINTKRSYYHLDETLIRTSLDSLETDRMYQIAQQEVEIIPEQRWVGNELQMYIPRQTVQAGFAEVKYDNQHKMWLAFNSSSRESDVRQILQEDLEQFAQQHQNITVFNTSDSKSFSNEIKARYLGQPLWKYAIVLALFFLLVEILIIRFLK